MRTYFRLLGDDRKEKRNKYLQDRLLCNIFVATQISYEMEKIEALKFDCKLKARNLKTVTNTLINKNFNDLPTLKNYLECLKDNEKSIESLIIRLESKLSELSK